MNLKKSPIVRNIFRFIPANKKNIVLTFHHIPKNNLNLFNKLINNLERDFDFINPNLISDLFKYDLDKPRILITFDDGFRSNLDAYKNILMPKSIKALFFITNNFIGLKDKYAEKFSTNNFYNSKPQKSSYSGELDALSWEEIKWLKDHKNVIGCHTLNHKNLAKISEERLNYEVLKSKELLEKKIGVDIDMFAYPFGINKSINKKVIKFVSERFKYAFSNIRGSVNQSPSNYFIYRQNIDFHSNQWEIDAILKNKLNFIYFRERLIAKRKNVFL